MTTLEAFKLAEPTKATKRRTVTFEWELAKLPSESSREANKRLLAVLTVSHSKAGPNYFSGTMRTEDVFSVTLSQQTATDILNSAGEMVGSSQGFMLFKGLGIAELPAGSRFSAKRLQDAAVDALAILTEHYEAGEVKVLRYFDPDGLEA